MSTRSFDERASIYIVAIKITQFIQVLIKANTMHLNHKKNNLNFINR